MFDRLKTTIARFRVPTIAEREEAYLAASVSLVDLERREREVSRGLFRSSSFQG